MSCIGRMLAETYKACPKLLQYNTKCNVGGVDVGWTREIVLAVALLVSRLMMLLMLRGIILQSKTGNGVEYLVKRCFESAGACGSFVLGAAQRFC